MPLPDLASFRAPPADLIARFASIVGREHALTDPDMQLPYLREWRDAWVGRSALVLRPGSVDEVSKILALANDTRTAVVPQGGNTGLVGGQIPFESGAEVVVSMSRLKRVRSVDAAGYALTVEAGMTLAEVQAAAAAAGRLFPLSLPSEGTCQLGGNLSTNAGGVGALAYGVARSLVLGLEVVLADGRVWNGLKALKKDNTGYDLKDLFIGAEGTLGIITAAVLRLFPKPAERATAFVALDRIEKALDLFALAQDAAGRGLTAFEFIPAGMMAMIVRNIPGARAPFATPYPWTVLIELSGFKADGASQVLLESALGEASEKGLIEDAVIAASLGQARDFWRLREAVSEAQKPEGGNYKHDISVPVHRIPEFIARANAAVEKICPGCRPLAQGHFGDGNVHYNVLQPAGMARGEYGRYREDIVAAVHGIATDMDGSISAEHGIGRMKRGELAKVKSPLDLELMRNIKAVFDPNGIMNPGKVL